MTSETEVPVKRAAVVMEMTPSMARRPLISSACEKHITMRIVACGKRGEERNKNEKRVREEEFSSPQQ